MASTINILALPPREDLLEYWGITPQEMSTVGWDFLERRGGLRYIEADTIQTFAKGLGWAAVVAQDGLGFGAGVASSILCEEYIDDNEVFNFLPRAVWQMFPPRTPDYQIAAQYAQFVSEASRKHLADGPTEGSVLEGLLTEGVLPTLGYKDLGAATYRVAAVAGHQLVRNAFDDFRMGDSFYNLDQDIEQAGGIVIATSRMMGGFGDHLPE